DVAIDEALRARGGPLEEHVLEVVGQPELVPGLVAAPCAHPQLDRDDFTRGVLLNEDAGPVVQHVAARGFDGGGRFDRPGARAARQHQPGEAEMQQNRPYPIHAGCQATTRGATGRMPYSLDGWVRAQRQLAWLTIPNK